MAMDNGMPVENQAAETEEITNDEIMDALAKGRGYLAASVRPETPADRPEMRHEWRRGSVAPTVYIDTSGTTEQFAIRLWQSTLK